MKILQVTNSFKPAWGTGGITRVAYDISRNLVKRGHTITVFATEKGLPKEVDIKRNSPVEVDGMEVYYFSNASGYLAEKAITIPYIAPFVIRERLKEFDIIHLHDYRRMITPFIHHYARLYGIPYVIQPHTSVATYFQKEKLKKIFDKLFGYKIMSDASKVIAVSEEEAASLRQIGVDTAKISVIYNGMDIEPFENLAEPGSFKAENGINGKLILYLGRINETKGLDFAVKAFSELCKELNQVTFVIAGHDDGYKTELEKLVKHLNLGNKVRYTGSLNEEDKLSAYVDADLFVHTVKYMGGVGLAPLEAILSDTPVVVTSGCGEVIKKANCGYFVEYGDIAGLRGIMRRAIENPEEGKHMVERGKKYIYENLVGQRVIDKIEKVYSEV